MRSSGGVSSEQQQPATVVVESSTSELQAMVAELRSQLQSVREETEERERRLQAEVQRLTEAGHNQDSNTGQQGTYTVCFPCLFA